MKSTFVKSMLLTTVCALSSFAATVTINVPFEFTAAGKTLPAGEYTFVQETAGVMVMTGATPNSSMLFLTRMGDSEKTDKPGVVFAGQKLSCIRMTNGETLELMKASK